MECLQTYGFQLERVILGSGVFTTGESPSPETEFYTLVHYIITCI